MHSHSRSGFALGDFELRPTGRRQNQKSYIHVTLKTSVMQRLMPQCGIWRSMTKSRPVQKGGDVGCTTYVLSHSCVMLMGLVPCLSVIFV